MDRNGVIRASNAVRRQKAEEVFQRRTGEREYGRRMGHAGAIVSGADESAAAKKKLMAECGISVVESPADIGRTVKEALK